MYTWDQADLSIRRRLRGCRDNVCAMNVLEEHGLLPVADEGAARVAGRRCPRPAGRVPWDRLAGAMIGTAVGDALGSTLEFVEPREKRWLEEAPPGYPRGSFITDDTQLAFRTLEVILRAGWLDPGLLAHRYAYGHITGIGVTTSEFVSRYRGAGMPWWRSGLPSAGNGAVMKLAPVPFPTVYGESPCLYADALASAIMIYRDRLALASAAAYSELILVLLGSRRRPDPWRLLNRVVETMRLFEGDDTRYKARHGDSTYEGPGWAFLEKTVSEALREQLHPVRLHEAIGSSAYLMETLPIATYTFLAFMDEPWTALALAAASSLDADTVAAIVGYLLGALHGLHGLPGELVEQLLSPDGKPRLPRKYIHWLSTAEKIYSEAQR